MKLEKKEMINFINQHLSDKTLKLGCVVRSKTHWIVTITEIFDVCSDDIIEHKICDPFPHWEMLFVRYKTYSWDVSLNNIIEVIWNPITLDDILYSIYKNSSGMKRSEEIIRRDVQRIDSLLLHRNPRTPLNKQSITCIWLIYNITIYLLWSTFKKS